MTVVNMAVVNMTVEKFNDVARHVIIMALTCYAMWYFLIILLKVS